MSTRPPTISIKDLAKAVDQAVKVAGEKHELKFSPEFVVRWPIIFGFVFDTHQAKIEQAEQIAAEITQHVTTGEGTAQAFGVTQLEPAVLATRGIIICGMIPPESTLEF